VNLVKQLTEIKLFQVLFTDFTELVYAYGGKKTWLIVYLEGVSKKILGDHIGTGTSESALKAYHKAKKYLRREKVNLNEVIVHQDQGTQFKSYEYVDALLKDGISLSYSRKGHPEDNPEMESFFGRFKDEWRDEIFELETLDEVIKFVKRKKYYYNNYRIDSNHKKYSPNEFLRIQKRRKAGTLLKKG